MDYKGVGPKPGRPVDFIGCLNANRPGPGERPALRVDELSSDRSATLEPNCGPHRFLILAGS